MRGRLGANARTTTGMMRAVIQILQPVIVNGVQTWNTQASVLRQTPARLNSEVGTEQPVGLGPPNELRTTVHMRYRPGGQILPRMRVAVVGTSRVLEIDSVIDVEFRHEELILACREVSP